jgi:hypothetical protein
MFDTFTSFHIIKKGKKVLWYQQFLDMFVQQCKQTPFLLFLFEFVIINVFYQTVNNIQRLFLFAWLQ